MSVVATVCPECGKISTHVMFWGNSDEFFDNKTTCDCGHEYENFPNVPLSVPKEENSIINS